MVLTKQPNLGPTNRGGLGPDQTELWFGSFLLWKHFLDGLYLRTNQEVLAEPEKGKTLQQNKMSHSSTWGEKETKCFIIIIIIEATKLICSFIFLHSFKL